MRGGVLSRSLAMATSTFSIAIPPFRRSSTIIFTRPPPSLCSFHRLRLPPPPSRFSSLAMASSVADALPSQTSMEREEIDFWERVQKHQKAAAKLLPAEEARTVLDQSLNAYLSTISQKYEGFPYGSFIDIAADEEGSIIVAVSNLSPHTKDLETTPNCSLLIMKDKLDRSDVIVTYIGEAIAVSEVEQKAVRDAYLIKHPEAFWVDFGDFKFLRIKPKHVRYATGIVTPFNATAVFSGDEFKDAKVDPIAQFSAPIAAHMNRDHAEATRMMVEKAIGTKVDHGKILDLDRMGLNVQVVFKGKPIKLRVPFPRPANDRKDVKTLIVQMVGSQGLPDDNAPR